MKNKLALPYLILIVAPLLFGCGGQPQKGNENNLFERLLSSGETYQIDSKESSVKWKGSMLVGTNSHVGYVYISKGTLVIDDSKLVGGTAEVNMNSIVDENHSGNSGLVDHLKSDDFFDVEKFPLAKIKITKSETEGENTIVTGNLTIKGISHPVTFPAKITINNDMVKMNGKLTIDRTLWNVRYKSGKFYDLLADETMSDAIDFTLGIVAKK